MKSIPILCYHRVCPPELRGTDSPSLCVSPEQFESQLAMLKSLGYSALSLQRAAAYWQGRRGIVSKPVIITFDDGYEDNYLYAFPLLKKASFTATLFLVTGALQKTNRWDCGTTLMLKEEQVEEMAASGICFGSHTVSHIDMSVALPIVMERELRQSKEKLEMLTLRTDIPFCYPYSRLNADAKTCVQDAGYFCALSGDGTLGQKELDLFELGRVQVFPSTSLFGFWKKIQPWYPKWMEMQKKWKGR